MNHEQSSSGQKKIVVLGSTGSIGTQALEIAAEKPEIFTVGGLSANNNWKLLAAQANRFKPKWLVLVNEKHRKEFENALNYQPETIGYGTDALTNLAVESESDILLNALVGYAGFRSTYEALKNQKRVALANKESLVVGGELLSTLPGFSDNLVPVDSEHSAMLQCLVGEPADSIQKIIITASGGPFRNWSKEKMKSITVEDALKHPNWEMGAKITVDSSTMMNKGLEIIEAYWLYGISIDKIEPVIHPQSILHSIIEFKDGSSKAQLGPPDMKVPILYALSYPGRIEFPNRVLDYTKSLNLTFQPVDHERFPCINLAVESVKDGGAAPAVLNAANEIAVERFLNKQISYIQIPKIIEQSLQNIEFNKPLTADFIAEIDSETRSYASRLFT